MVHAPISTTSITIGRCPRGLLHALAAASAGMLTSAATTKMGDRSWKTLPSRGARRCATAYIDQATAASMTRALPARLPPWARSPPLAFTMPTPASVSDAPVTRRAGSCSPSSARASRTFDTCPKSTSRPPTAAVVSRTPWLKSRKSIPRATPASADQPSPGSQRVPAPPTIRKQSAAHASRVTPRISGENPARAAFVATGPTPQHAAAAVPFATPAGAERPRGNCRGTATREHERRWRVQKPASSPPWRAVDFRIKGSDPMPPDGSAPRSSRYARYVLAVLVLVYVFNFLDRQIISILAERIRADLGVTDAELGFLYGTAFAVFYALFGIPLGRLADVWDRRKLIALGLAMWSAMTALSGLARTFPALALARIGVGIGEASAAPAAFSLLSDWFPRERRAT